MWDREENVKSLETSLKKAMPSATYKGFYFLGAQKYLAQPISKEEFYSRWNELARIVNEMN